MPDDNNPFPPIPEHNEPPAPVLQDEDDATPTPEPAPTPTPSPAPSISADVLADALRKSGLTPQTPTPPERKPLTPEERAAVRKSLGYMEIDDTFMQRFGNMETQKEALQALRDGDFNYVMKVVDALVQERLGGYDERLSKYEQADYARREAETVAAFNKKYEQLANPALEPIRNAAIDHLMKQNRQFTSADERDEAVAKAMESIIQASAPDFKLNSAGSTPAKPKPNALKPAPRAGGGGGAPPADGDNANGGRPRAASLFPPIRD